MASAAIDSGAPLRVTGAWIPTLIVLALTPTRVAPAVDGRVPLVAAPPLVVPPLGAAVAAEPLGAACDRLAAAAVVVVPAAGAPAWMPEFTWVWPAPDALVAVFVPPWSLVTLMAPMTAST